MSGAVTIAMVICASLLFAAPGTLPSYMSMYS